MSFNQYLGITSIGDAPAATSLQRDAVIAREYGLPCVSGVNCATTSIPDGALIEVDGSNGIVRLVEPA